MNTAVKFRSIFEIHCEYITETDEKREKALKRQRANMLAGLSKFERMRLSELAHSLAFISDRESAVCLRE
jgi:hypothetical protein